ncbi:MAG TPA: GNAT family N-acetyltransferase [Mobilitalea sp.]|nr:GNAT family N-acetyltransferase [Mobilitalea sp.]
MDNCEPNDLNELIYRLAKISDAEELRRLNDDFNGENSNSIEGIREAIAREDAETIFVAETKDRLVGFCCGQLLRSMCYSVFYAEITEIYIEEALQRKGIGQGLINCAEEWYRQNNIHDFQLFTGFDNSNAQRFYEHIGYRPNDDILYRKRDWWKQKKK